MTTHRPVRFGPPISEADIRASRNNSRAADVETFVRKACAPVLTRVYGEFCFDKFPYVLCDPPTSEHAAWHHKSGNCRAFALHTVRRLREAGVDAYPVGGAPPRYFMRPTYRAVCHAAVFVPFAADPRAVGVLIDPSVYAPPIVVAAPGRPVDPALSVSAGPAGTVMRDYCTTLSASARPGSGHLANPVSPGREDLRVELPKEGCLVVDVLPDNGPPPFTYVLADVLDFDGVVTRRVHGINRDLFRTSTDPEGRFLATVRYSPDAESATLVCHKTKRSSSIPGAGLTRDAVRAAADGVGGVEAFMEKLRFRPSHRTVERLHGMLERGRQATSRPN